MESVCVAPSFHYLWSMTVTLRLPHIASVLCYLLTPIPRMYTLTTCQICNLSFNAKNTELNRGMAKYCSRKCCGKATALKRAEKRKTRLPNAICAYCNSSFYRNPSKLTGSRSNLFFCCRKHKDSAQRIGGIQAIMPPHYGTATELDSKGYRKIAFTHHPAICIVCKYDKYKEVLEVHHKDLDRNNNSPDNLEIRCPTHHTEWHFETKTGKYGPRT
jgi:hypothetical protein